MGFYTSSIKIISEGGTVTRLEKTKVVSNYEPSFKYLNVCTQTIENCCRCEKCIRTMLGLDAIGKLDDYRLVFDVEYYKNNKQEYLETLFYKTKITKRNITYNFIYPYLKDQIKFRTKLKVYIKLVFSFVLAITPKRTKT